MQWVLWTFAPKRFSCNFFFYVLYVRFPKRKSYNENRKSFERMKYTFTAMPNEFEHFNKYTLNRNGIFWGVKQTRLIEYGQYDKRMNHRIFWHLDFLSGGVFSLFKPLNHSLIIWRNLKNGIFRIQHSVVEKIQVLQIWYWFDR